MKTIRIICCVLVLTLPGCGGHAPPNLSPAGVAAFNNTRIIKGLDVVRDLAILANEQQPPVLSENTTRKIVTWHRSALQLINVSAAGWPTVVQTALDEVMKDVPADEARILGPYIALAKTLLTEAVKP